MTLKSLPQFTCLLLLTVLVGCASRPSMQELKEEAMDTGDWSEVHKRQRMDRAMGRVTPDAPCPEDMILRCSKKGERELCDCIYPHVLRKF